MRQKIFVGPKIRQLREQGGLNQAAFAERLGISASYLNQIENNQRPLTAQVMVALAQTFSIDVGRLRAAGRRQGREQPARGDGRSPSSAGSFPTVRT